MAPGAIERLDVRPAHWREWQEGDAIPNPGLNLRRVDRGSNLLLLRLEIRCMPIHYADLKVAELAIYWCEIDCFFHTGGLAG
jgi:hypothetical protein